MLTQLSSGDSLTVVMSGAAVTTNPTYSVQWTPLPKDKGDPDVVNESHGSLSGATAVTVLSSPSASARRRVETLHVYNGDTASVSITVTKVTSTTSYVLGKTSIPVGGMATFTEGGQVQVTDSSGQLLQTVADSITGTGLPNGTGVAATEEGSNFIHKTTLTLTALTIAAADEAGVVAYASHKVYDMPAGNILILGAVTDLDLTKSSAGIDDTWDGDVGVGSTAADNDNALATTEQNICPTTATPQAVAGATTADTQSTDTVVLDGTATAVDVYLNLIVDDADHDVDGTPCNIIIDGTIVLTWINLGDN